MKRLIFIPLMLLVLSSIQAQPGILNWTHGENSYQIQVDNFERTMKMWVPSSYDGSTDVPLVFAFHGTNGSGRSFYNNSGWKEKAEAEGFIAVFPTSGSYPIPGKGMNTTKWVVPGLEDIVLPGTVLEDDVRFIDSILAKVQRTFSINADQIFATGFSNGANFSIRMGIERAHVFAAIAPACAPIVYRFGPYTPTEYIPVYFLVGNKDPKFTDLIGGNPLPMNPTAIMATFVGNTLREMTNTFGLSDTYVSRERDHHISLRFTDGPHGNELIFSLAENLRHKYPNGENYPFVAADEFWDFFMRHPKI